MDAVMKDQQLKRSLANQKFSKIAEASCANSNNPVEKCLETNPHCIKKQTTVLETGKEEEEMGRSNDDFPVVVVAFETSGNVADTHFGGMFVCLKPY